MIGLDHKDTYIGNEASERRGILNFFNPIIKGRITNWDEMEKIWHYALYTALKVTPEEYPLMLTECPLTSKAERERMTTTLFETFNVPAFYVSMTSVLGLYSTGKTTGMVLDSGKGVTSTVPIFEGFAIPHAITRTDLAGEDVTQVFYDQLTEKGFNFAAVGEKDVVRCIKEEIAYVSQNYSVDDKGSTDTASYTLPDGNVIDVGAERFRCAEILFNPSLAGKPELKSMHENLQETVNLTDSDIQQFLYSNLVLNGGSTLFPGLPERLAKEMEAIVPETTRLNIVAPPERHYSVWIGGSMLASLQSFN
jgi:actin